VSVTHSASCSFSCPHETGTSPRQCWSLGHLHLHEREKRGPLLLSRHQAHQQWSREGRFRAHGQKTELLSKRARRLRRRRSLWLFFLHSCSAHRVRHPAKQFHVTESRTFCQGRSAILFILWILPSVSDQIEISRAGFRISCKSLQSESSVHHPHAFAFSKSSRCGFEKHRAVWVRSLVFRPSLRRPTENHRW